jgi:enamine deaminase RidA (YjgF/YER057c/UK114 family)
MSTLQYYNYPGSEKNSKEFHYSQAVKIGSTVKTSGQGGWDAEGTIVTNTEEQVAKAFDNVQKALQVVDARFSWKNVYAVRSYHTNVSETFDMATANFKARMPDHAPVWTCVEIPKLGLEGMVIEIEVEAVISE